MQWRNEAMEELLAKTEALNAKFHLGKWPTWNYDLKERTLTFLDGDRPKVIAGIRLIGSTSNVEKTWLWGWAGSVWPPQVAEGTDQVRAFGEKNGILELAEGLVSYRDDMNLRGWLLSAVATRVMNGLGVYRTETEGGALFFLYTDIRFA
jgi:hypothetical protein